MQRDLAKQLAAFIAKLPEAAKVPMHDLVLAFVSTVGCSREVRFVAVVEGVLQSGMHAAQQTFLLLSAEGRSNKSLQKLVSYVGLELSPVRRPIVSQQCTTTSKSVAGMLHHITTEPFTTECVCADGSDQRCVDVVQVHKLITAQHSGLGWLVVSSDELFSVSTGSGEASDDDADFIRNLRAVDEEPDFTELQCLANDLGDWLAADLDSVIDTTSEAFANVSGELKQDGDPASSLGAVPWSEALSAHFYHVYGKHTVLSRLGLRCTEAWEIWALAADYKRPLGKLYMSWGSTMSANCRAHASCKCLVRLDHTAAEQVESDLFKWLAFGHTCDRDEHVDRAAQLKMKHGMRARPPL